MAKFRVYSTSTSRLSNIQCRPLAPFPSHTSSFLLNLLFRSPARSLARSSVSQKGLFSEEEERRPAADSKRIYMEEARADRQLGRAMGAGGREGGTRLGMLWGLRPTISGSIRHDGMGL